MLNKKQNLKSGKNKDKEREFVRKKEETNKNEKGLMKKNFVIECFDVVLFMKQKQRRKKKGKNRQKQETKRKQKRKTRRKEIRKEKQRDRERESKKGGGQKGLGKKKH